MVNRPVKQNAIDFTFILLSAVNCCHVRSTLLFILCYCYVSSTLLFPLYCCYEFSCGLHSFTLLSSH